MPGPITPFSLRWSCTLHGLVLLCAIITPLLPAFKKEPLEIIEFTVVLNENLIEPIKQPDKQPPKKIEDPEDPVEPIKPKDLPDPIKDAVVLEPKKPKDPVKPKDPKPKDVVKPKDPVKPFKKGDRVEVKPNKAPPSFTNLKRVTDKQLSSKEIADALAAGAKIGSRNQLPANELSRCVSLVRTALYEAWEQPGQGEAGSRPAKLLIRLDSNGKIVSYRIMQSSGSELFDSTVLRAAAKCDPIRGLTVAFLNEHDELTIEFKLE